jgi:isochorismate synthase
VTLEAPIAWRAARADGRDPLEAVRRHDGDAIWIASPARDVEIGALGTAALIETRGPGRFEDAERAAAALFARIDADGSLVPLLVGGFAFHDGHAEHGWWRGFPSLRLVVPRTLVVRRGPRTWAVTVTGGDAAGPDAGGDADDAPAEDLMPEVWDRRVRRVLADVAAGRLAKLVLSRSRTLGRAGVDAIGLVRRLREERPACTTFLVRRGDAVFLGSTPETLVSVRGGVAETMALAGSMRARAGESCGAAAARLLACPKNAAEHDFVARAVRDGLAASSESVETTAVRAVVRLPESLHLATTYRARLGAGVSALGVAAALHPTPAVGGVPSAAARRRLAAEEPDRGWYAGGVGWLDAAGEGDWSVALRCALLRGDRVRLFAGAGIVAGSEPATEWDETEAKMSTMLRLFAEHARAA